MQTVLGDMSRETMFFIVLIVVFFVFLNLTFNRRAIQHGPTILTTCGIFGTFVGIAVGLSEFDTNNVREGVPALLSGLKTAFWASVFGVGGALWLKLRVFLFGSSDEDEDERHNAATIDDVVKSLRDLNYAIAGRHETSLLTQLKLLRATSESQTTVLRHALGGEVELTPAPIADETTSFSAMKAAFADGSIKFGKRADDFKPGPTVEASLPLPQ